MVLEAGPSQMCTARPALARTGRASPAEELQRLARAPLPLLRLQAPLLQGRLPVRPGPYLGGAEAAPAAPRVLRPSRGQEEKREAPAAKGGPVRRCRGPGRLHSCCCSPAWQVDQETRPGECLAGDRPPPELPPQAPSLCPPCARASPQVCVRAEMRLYKDAKSGAPTGFASVPFASQAPLLPVAGGVREKGGSALTSAVPSGLVVCRHLLWGRVCEGLSVSGWVGSVPVQFCVFHSIRRAPPDCQSLVLLGTEGKKLGTPQTKDLLPLVG